MSGRGLVVFACFVATFCLYVDRVGFALAYTGIAQSSDLDERTKGLTMSAFYYGYATFQVPAGVLAPRFGGTRCLTVAFAVWTAVSLVCDVERFPLVFLSRVGVGAAQGFVIPSIHTVLAQCVPAHEKSRSVSLATSGMYLGSALAMAVLPTVISYNGPVNTLTCVGCLPIFAIAVWCFVGQRDQHLSSGSVARGNNERAVSWSQFARSAAVWAICVNSFTFHYALYLVMNWLPTYFDEVIQVPLTDLGKVKVFPYLLMFAFSNFGGVLGDTMVLRGASVGMVRKCINTSGFLVTAVGLCLMASARKQEVMLAICSTTLTLSALGFSRGGFSVNHMDIAPGHAGVVIGLSNTAGTLAGVVGVSLTGVVLESAGGAAEHSGVARRLPASRSFW